MDKRLRITGLVSWILTAFIIFLGGFVSLFFGLTLGAYDISLFLLEELDAYTPDPTYTGGGFLIIITVTAIVGAVLVFILSVITFFLSKKPWFGASTVMIVVNCVILFVNALLQLVCVAYLNLQHDIPFEDVVDKRLFFISPAIEFVILIGMIVLAVFSIRSMKFLNIKG